MKKKSSFIEVMEVKGLAAAAPPVAVEASAVMSLGLAYMSLHLVTTLSKSWMSYREEYMASGIFDFIILTTVASLYSSWLGCFLDIPEEHFYVICVWIKGEGIPPGMKISDGVALG